MNHSRDRPGSWSRENSVSVSKTEGCLSIPLEQGKFMSYRCHTGIQAWIQRLDHQLPMSLGTNNLKNWGSSSSLPLGRKCCLISAGANRARGFPVVGKFKLYHCSDLRRLSPGSELSKFTVEPVGEFLPMSKSSQSSGKSSLISEYHRSQTILQPNVLQVQVKLLWNSTD